MADQVNVCVRNVSQSVDHEVFREHGDGTREPSISIPPQNEDTILLPEPGVFLIIKPPQEHDFNFFTLTVTKNDDLVSSEKMDDHWKMQITDNPNPPEVPLDVNVEIGGDPP